MILQGDLSKLKPPKKAEKGVVVNMNSVITVNSKIEISNLNTTLVGDYISAAFPQYNEKWLVQAIGNAMFASTQQSMQER